MKKLTGVVVAGLATWAFVGIRYNDPEAVYQFYGVFLIIIAILFHYAFRPLKL